MPLYEDDEDYAPAPNAPPVAPGVLGPAGPGATAPAGTPEAPSGPVGPQGGGGGGAAPWALPALPGLNIPGAPKFNAPVYVAPNKDAMLNDPGYQLRVDQGNRALERSAAAKGMLRGGNTLTDLSQWNQNLASQEYQNVVNREQAAYQNRYRAAYDAFAPEMAAWNMKAGGLRDMQRDRYSADLQHALQIGQPRGGGGGGEPDLSWLTQLPPPPAVPGGGAPPQGLPGGGPGPYVPGGDDPFQDPYY